MAAPDAAARVSSSLRATAGQKQTHATATATVPRPQFLFALSAPGARLTRVRGGYRLRLERPHPGVVKFSDRPDRLAGSEALAAFVRNWRRNGFVTDPPNAAVVALGAPAGRDVLVLELRRPRLSGAGLSFLARPVATTPAGLAPFASRADRPRALRLGPTSLFVDGAPGAGVRYQPITIRFANVQPGQQLGVSLTGNGSPVAFSNGPDFQDDSGIAITGLSGTIPVSRLSLSSSRVQLATSSEGGGVGLTGTLRAYLVAEGDADTLFLRSTADPGVELTAQIGDSVPQVVNPSQTLFSWEPV